MSDESQGQKPAQPMGDAAADALKAVREAVAAAKRKDAAPPPEDAQAQAAEAVAVAQAQAAAQAQSPKAPAAAPFELPSFGAVSTTTKAKPIDLLADVNLDVKIELGRTRMLVEDVLKLTEGAVVELDKLAGDPVDVYVNDRPIARGEVLVLNDNFCIRINEIVDERAAEEIARERRR